MRRLLFPFILITLLLVTVFTALWWSSQKLPPNTLAINNHRFTVTVASTDQEKIKGLAGIKSLGDFEGMLFPLDTETASFWMKGMVMDIDIIWIKNDVVAGINHHVSAPKPGEPDSDLPHYHSPVAYPQAVLEVAAGRAEALGIKTGDPVKFHPGLR